MPETGPLGPGKALGAQLDDLHFRGQRSVYPALMRPPAGTILSRVDLERESARRPIGATGQFLDLGVSF
jgi:hypothetical protein